MANSIRTQEEILNKLNISALNPMQEEAIPVIEKTINTVLLSPTGTGKTLAFLLPLVKASATNTCVIVSVYHQKLDIQCYQS